MEQAAQPAPIEGSFQLVEADYMAFARRLARRPATRAWAFVYWTVSVAIAGTGAWVIWKGSLLGYVCIAYAVFMLLLRIIILPAFCRRRFRGHSLWNKLVRFQANGEALAMTYGNSESRMAWSDFVKYERTGEYFFFWVDQLQALIVPLRAFTDAEQAERLWQLANSGAASDRA